VQYVENKFRSGTLLHGLQSLYYQPAKKNTGLITRLTLGQMKNRNVIHKTGHSLVFLMDSSH